MTNKELKDYCKTCSVEPPAMRFKCPECEHNPDKEQIIIDGVDVSECIDFNRRDKVSCYHLLYDKCNENPNCYFKQLARKTQECEAQKSKINEYERLKKKHNFLKYANDMAKEDVSQTMAQYHRLEKAYEELGKRATSLEEIANDLQTRNHMLTYENQEKQKECEELKEKLYQIEDVVKPINEQLPEDSVIRQIMLILNDCNGLQPSRYLKALEEIEEIAKDGLNPICYKSNCSRCKCYNGDDCKAGMISLINNYFTENGEFADGNGDFAEALEDLLDKERSRCNRALPISKKILDIINKAKGEGNEDT